MLKFFLVLLLVTSAALFLIVNPILSKRNNKNINVSKENLFKHVKFLTDLNPPRNAFNIESLNKAAEYIYNHFKVYCENTYYQIYRVGETEYKNVICEFGSGESIIVIGAHYDVCCEQPGADDNASGVAGLLEIARLISEEKPNLKNRIQLVAYTLEEPPFFSTSQMGSYIHAERLYRNGEKVKYMISLEMIGYFSDKKGSQKFPFPIFKFFYPDRGNFIGIVGRPKDWYITRKIKEKMIEASSIDVRSINIPNIIPGVDFSDHRNYWIFGYNAVMITDTAFYRNPNYHEKTDTIETLDFERMSEVVKGVYWAVIST